eukprot:444948_1
MIYAFENINYKSITITNAKSLNHENEITNLKINASLTKNYPIVNPNGTSQPTYYLVTLFSQILQCISSIAYLPVVTVFHGICNFALASLVMLGTALLCIPIISVLIYLLILITSIVASLDTGEKLIFAALVTFSIEVKNIHNLKGNLLPFGAILISVTAVIHYIPMKTLLPDAILTPANIVNDGNDTTYIPEFEPT